MNLVWFVHITDLHGFIASNILPMTIGHGPPSFVRYVFPGNALSWSMEYLKATAHNFAMSYSIYIHTHTYNLYIYIYVYNYSLHNWKFTSIAVIHSWFWLVKATRWLWLLSWTCVAIIPINEFAPNYHCHPESKANTYQISDVWMISSSSSSMWPAKLLFLDPSSKNHAKSWLQTCLMARKSRWTPKNSK